jgi:hypothetical protein
MAQTQLADVIVPSEFTVYQAENSMVSTALYRSGVAVKNGEMASQLQASAQSFTVPFWSDLSDTEADITNDDPTVLSTPQKITAAAQIDLSRIELSRQNIRVVFGAFDIRRFTVKCGSVRLKYPQEIKLACDVLPNEPSAQLVPKIVGIEQILQFLIRFLSTKTNSIVVNIWLKLSIQEEK